MALITNWLPPSRENWEFTVWLWQFFPLITLIQWLPQIDRIYTMGKTSTKSRFNIPGRIGWLTMEIPGPLVLLYIMSTLPTDALPWENKVMASFYVVHYAYRAVVCPLIAPSMSPISPHIWLFAVLFQASNGLQFGGWLGGYGPTTRADWHYHEMNYKSGARLELGMMIFLLGFVGNIFHDDELREIRRAAQRRIEREEQEEQERDVQGGEREKLKKKTVDKVYMIPKNGLFTFVLYPHYLCEWIEWSGFWLMGGSYCLPARNFVINEVATMLPRAVHGRRWYIERFGRDKVGNKKAVIPGIL
ncbi:3-oxo-5-alpha-steroid 4-dehydrogenase [Phlyctema vagabunda]|uniref:3-oxo-5-alpha-steroid 4-dehydrogenase n=1 Tax=Phlyctema vagabunda TaxID=108571 RepID=A0ABR4PWK7_9HELO